MNTSTVGSSITRRTMLGGFAVGAGAVLAAACGAAGTAAPADEMAEEKMEEKQAEAAPAPPEEVSILYLTYTRPARNEAEQALYGGFQEANPGITLDIKIVDGGGTGVRQNIPILFAAGTPRGPLREHLGHVAAVRRWRSDYSADAAHGSRWDRSL